MAKTSGLHDSCSHHIANLITFADAIMAIITAAATTTRPLNRNYLMDNRFCFFFFIDRMQWNRIAAYKLYQLTINIVWAHFIMIVGGIRVTGLQPIHIGMRIANSAAWNWVFIPQTPPEHLIAAASTRNGITDRRPSERHKRMEETAAIYANNRYNHLLRNGLLLESHPIGVSYISASRTLVHCNCSNCSSFLVSHLWHRAAMRHSW